MNKLLLSAALSLVLAAPAMAQPDHNNRGGNEHHETHGGNRGDHNSGSRPSAPAARPAPAVRPAPTPARPAIARPDNNNRPGNRPSSNRPGTSRPGNDHRPDFNRSGNNNRPGARPDHNNRPGFNRPNNNRPGVRPHPRPDYSKYRRAVTAPRRFHIGTYRAPHGYVYRRWSYGQYLPSAYWASSFWLSNFVAYGLFAPPPDAVWVRYGPDALLVDRYSGEVISVEYNVFY